MRYILYIIEIFLGSEISDKVAAVSGGMVASLLTFAKFNIGDFFIKCASAAFFALIGGAMGYLGKKAAEKIINQIKFKINEKKQKQN